jgi:uncharacterized protein
MSKVRRAGLVATTAAVPVALAYRFTRIYRERAGFPRRRAPRFDPADFGLAFERTTVRSAGGDLPAWFVPANGGRPGPGVALVHGWDSARDRMLGNIQFMNAAGFHCLAFDVRGHGANPVEALPISAGEFGADAGAAFATLLERPEVTRAALFGHSMGAAGAILAAAADPRVAALVSSSAPSDPRRLVVETFRLAHLPFPAPVAGPLSWLTSREFVRPRGHRLDEISAGLAIARYRGPILLVHGQLDQVIPVRHAERLQAAALAVRSERDPAVELYRVMGGGHTWLYEDAGYRRRIAEFLSETLGGPLGPAEAGRVAAAVPVERLPEPEEPLVGRRADHLVGAMLGGTPATPEPLAPVAGAGEPG